MFKFKKFFLKGMLCFLALNFPNTLEIFAKEYTVVLIPDSQNYTLNKNNIFHFKEQIKWIKRKKILFWFRMLEML